MSEYRKGVVLPESSPAHRVKRIEVFDKEWLGQYDYAVINPLQVAEDDWSDLPCIPLTTPSIRVRGNILPQLLILDRVDKSSKREELSARLSRYNSWGGEFISALIKSESSPTEVVEHFRFTLEQPRYGSSRRWWLRFYDPLVFRHMCWLLDSHQMDRLMGPIQTWCWPEGLGPWFQLNREGKVDTTIRLPLLKKNQWDVIDRFVILNSTIERLSLLAPESVKNITDYQKIDRLISEAQLKYRLIDEEDLILYAEQTMRFGLKVHDHPFIQKRFYEVNKQGIGYAELCNDLNDKDLERMATEMELETSHD